MMTCLLNSNQRTSLQVSLRHFKASLRHDESILDRRPVGEEIFFREDLDLPEIQIIRQLAPSIALRRALTE